MLFSSQPASASFGFLLSPASILTCKEFGSLLLSERSSKGILYSMSWALMVLLLVGISVEYSVASYFDVSLLIFLIINFNSFSAKKFKVHPCYPTTIGVSGNLR